MIDSLIVRKVKINDLRSLVDCYCNLPASVKRFFHPFPFDRKKVQLIFLILWLSAKVLPLVKQIYPKLVADLIVAFDSEKSRLAGFAFFHVTKKENSELVANAGPIIFEDYQGIGLGHKMYDHLIKNAKKAGISRFRVTVMENNVASVSFHKKIGYVNRGYTTDEFWDGKYEKNVQFDLKLA